MAQNYLSGKEPSQINTFLTAVGWNQEKDDGQTQKRHHCLAL